MSVETILIIVVILLAALLFGLGFVLKWLFIVAVVVLIVGLVFYIMDRRKGGT